MASANEQAIMWKHSKINATAGMFLIAAGLMTGCTTVKTTTTARSATEQLLLSTATDHAMQTTGLAMLAGHTVFVDGTYFDSYDAKYVLGTIRDGLSRAGARLTDKLTNSAVVLEPRSGALAIDESETMFGIPAVTLPIPLSGPVQTPEIAFYKATKQLALAKFALLAQNRESAKLVYSSGPLAGKSYDHRFRVLFISWHRTDIPEKQITRERTRKYQTWFPQSDPANLTETNKPAQ